jgi:histidinol-phosphate aminotransferase
MRSLAEKKRLDESRTGTASNDGVLGLVREDLRAFAGYRSARSERVSGEIWLNANESSWNNRADEAGLVRRYPQPQPEMLRARMAEIYGVNAEQLLIGRGSDEAIDLVVRALCRAERDPVVIAPPVFGMYAVCAKLQAAPLIEVSSIDGREGWRTEIEAMRDAALTSAAKIVFLCSPGNPTGEAISIDAIDALCASLRGRALVVVDEAYIEYADSPSATCLLQRHENLLVLRTLSKLHALAGARIGCAIADPSLIEILRRCQAPYPIPAPSVDLALAALMPEAVREAQRRAATIGFERERMYEALRTISGVRKVYPSAGNFLLLRFDRAERVYRALLEAGVVVRDMRATPRLEDALRITIGDRDENEAVLAVLRREGDAV